MTEEIYKLAELFKDDYGRPLHLSDGQKQIFETIIKRFPKRNIIMCATQYGKSLTVSLGILIRAVAYPERWAIVAPSERKARIIMNYVIQHLFDSPLFYSQLEISEPLERLKRERSKNRLTFKRGGEIFILSADSRNKQRAGESLLGFGAANVVLDESSLINDETYAIIKRMLGGHADNFFLEIGNPFRRNHFLKTWQSDDYNKIKIDYAQGIKEERFTPQFIEEMREQPFFKILYECEFPTAGQIDEQGWTVILTDQDVEMAMAKQPEPAGTKRLGVDIGRGGDYTVFVLRTDNRAMVLEKNRDPDLMSQVGRVKRIMEEHQISPKDVFIDDVGVGGGIVDRLKEQGLNVNAVKSGERAREENKFTNVRAECYWKLRQWILEENGSLEKCEDWYELCEVKYKEDSASRLKIEPKEEARRRGLDSPDTADALMLTFAGSEIYLKFFTGDGNKEFDSRKINAPVQKPDATKTDTVAPPNKPPQGGITTTVLDLRADWQKQGKSLEDINRELDLKILEEERKKAERPGDDGERREPPRPSLF